MILAAITALWQLPVIIVLGLIFGWAVNVMQRAREEYSTKQLIFSWVLFIITVGAAVAIA